MEKLKTNELSLGLNQTLRNDLVDNFEKIQKGVDSQADSLNKQILDMLGNVAPQDQNEVTQARIDANGKSYDTLKGREDATQLTAETSLEEERKTSSEVQSARTNGQSITYANLKQRLDNQEKDIANSMNEKISQISSDPETFSNVTALKNAYPNGKAGLFVVADTGHKFIWNNNNWTDAGIYQGVGISDSQKDDIVQLALDNNNYISGSDLINGSASNMGPYKAANSDTTATFTPNTLGKNWVRFSGSNKKYIGGIVDVDLIGSNNYRIWYDTAINFLVHNNSSQSLPLTIIVNAYDSNNNFIGSVTPVLNKSRNIKNSFIASNQTKEVSTVLPNIYSLFPNNYADISKVSLNFVYAGDDLEVDFMITELNLNTTNYVSNSASELTNKQKIAINNFLEQRNFINNGDFNVQTEIPLYGNTGTESINYIPNINGKNWLNIVSKDGSKSNKGFAFDYFLNTPETKWRGNQEAIVSTNIIKRDTTTTPLHLSAFVYAYDENNGLLATYTPLLSRVRNTTMMNNVETLIQFKIPKLSEISNVYPAKIAVVIVSEVASEYIDILVNNVSVRPNNIMPLASNYLSSVESQTIQSFIESDGYIKGGKLITSDTGAYSISTGKETITLEKKDGKNWIHYTSSDINTPYKGFQTDWRLDGEYQDRLAKPFKVIFDAINNVSSQLILTISFLDANNKRVGIYMPDIYSSGNVYRSDIIIPSPNDIITVGASTPVKAVIAFNDPIETNNIDFYMTGLEIGPHPIFVKPTTTNIPEIYFTGDAANMTKDISSTLRMDYKFPSGEVVRMYTDISWQGQSSTTYPKKNYKIKLYEDQNLNKKKKFSPSADIRKNSKFVLKANWIDSTHSRNIVNSGLYADITSTRSYIPDGLIGAENFAQIKGHPVNVYINGSYIGLYTLNTTKSSNMFNMKGDKENEIAIGADVWSDTTLFKTDSATLEEGKDFEVLAPDVVTDTTKASVNRLLAFVNSSSDTDFVNNINDYIDLPSMIDYFIFANVTQDTDGMGKNATYYTYDGKKWTAVAYDLDSTWGLHWDGASLDPYDQNAISFRGNKLFNRISSSFKEQIKARHKELRATVLRSDVVINKFERFIDEIGKENFDNEQTKWTTLPSLNLTDEQQLREAIVKRMRAVDKQIDSL